MRLYTHIRVKTPILGRFARVVRKLYPKEFHASYLNIRQLHEVGCSFSHSFQSAIKQVNLFVFQKFVIRYLGVLEVGCL